MNLIQLTDAQCKIFRVFYENYSCIRCIFKALKINDCEVYKQKLQYIQVLSHISEKLNLTDNLAFNYDFQQIIKKGENLVCRICSGILQNAEDPVFLQKIFDRLYKEDYEFEVFRIVTKIPLATQIRFYHMLCFVKEQMDEIIDKPEYYSVFINWQNNFIELKTIYKYVVTPILQQKLKKTPTNDDIFSINLQFFNDSDDEIAILPFKKFLKESHDQKLQEKLSKKVKLEGNQKAKQTTATHYNIQEIVKLNPIELMKLLNNLGPQAASQPSFEVSLFHAPIYIFGNYLKFSRMLSQTQWYLEGRKASESSIQEQVGKVVLPWFKTRDNKFHSGGREDMDVRMLGEGRPFVFEIENPKRTLLKKEDIKAIEDQINQSNLVNVNSLRITDKSCFEILKDSEQNKIKQYAAVVYTTTPITEQQILLLETFKNLNVQQNTPLRVLHRRTLMVREKCIHKMKVQYINQNMFVLHILASAGTYIKEFVHEYLYFKGDLERTMPNIGSILNVEADILQLDVIRLFTSMQDEVWEFFENTEKFNLKI